MFFFFCFFCFFGKGFGVFQRFLKDWGEDGRCGLQKWDFLFLGFCLWSFFCLGLFKKAFVLGWFVVELLDFKRLWS